MLLSDRDIRAAIAAGRVMIEPYEAEMVQPSSVDVRIDRYFRVFENHRYPHIDPAADQSDLTREVEPNGDEPFILHPGEFVLGSTLEVVVEVERGLGETFKAHGADDEIRTRDIDLGKVALYQLSYIRMPSGPMADRRRRGYPNRWAVPGPVGGRDAG